MKASCRAPRQDPGDRGDRDPGPRGHCSSPLLVVMVVRTQHPGHVTQSRQFRYPL